jgi:4-hydroxy-4-methyl-2-oxoglutarate aldolase
MNEALNRLAGIASATICEAQELRGIVDHRIRPVWSPVQLAGPAFTVQAPAGDNLPIHLAIAEAPAGSVLAVACGEDESYALIGDIMAQAAMKRGLAGLVTDGMIRDSRPVREMGFPVFCRGLQIRGPGKRSPGRRGEPVSLGGVVVRPGDYVIGDDDGVVIVRPEEAEATLKAALAREEKEQGVMRQIAAGRTTVEIMGLGSKA